MDSIVAISIQKYSMAIFFLHNVQIDEDWSSKPRDYEGKNYTFLNKMAKIGISYQMSQQKRD